MKRYYCPVCGHGQDEDATCASCRMGPALDIEDSRQRETLEREDARWRRNRNMRFLSIAVVIAIAIQLGLDFVPGYSELRLRTFALPFGVDRYLFIGFLAFCIDLGLQRKLGSRHKFEFLAGDAGD